MSIAVTMAPRRASSRLHQPSPQPMSRTCSPATSPHGLSSAGAATVDLVIVEHRDACGRAPWLAPLEATSLAASLLGADARFACIAIDAVEGCRRAPLRPVCPVVERAGAIAAELLALADEG